MIRPPIALVALAALAGGALFHIAFQVSALEDRLALLNDEIRAERDTIHVLRAEWTHLNQPERLADLSVRYLGMEPVTVASVANVDAVPRRLPDSLVIFAENGAEELFPRPRLKPPSPPKFASRKVAAVRKETAPYAPVPDENRAFKDLLVRILQPATAGGT